jgi:NAD(P)-dependent dehydrogenase (short-subunit alcohol dehydrogenase family)
MSTFSGKAVLVTGAGTGIGYALCQAFASAGAIVALNDIDATLCQSAAQQINGTLGVERVHPYVCDVADVEAVRTMFQRFIDTAGRLDIAIANAGVTNYGAFLTYTPEAFDRLASVTPDGRVGYVEDIVAAALYLASPEARHVTGHTLVVDGGWTLQSPLPAGQPDLPAYSSQGERTP